LGPLEALALMQVEASNSEPLMSFCRAKIRG